MYNDLRVPVFTDGAIVACVKETILALCNMYVWPYMLLTPTPAHSRLFDAIVRDKVH